MLNLRLLGGVGALTLVAGALGGWTARDWKADADWAAAEKQAFERREKMAGEVYGWGVMAGKFLGANQTQASNDRTTIRESYHEVRVPADCAVPPAVVRVLDAAIARANAAAAGNLEAAVPQPAASPGASDRPAPR